jgi:hypothetical protein
MSAMKIDLRRTTDSYRLDKNTFCPVKFMLFDSRTKEVKKVIQRSNLVLYGAADILALLISGNPDYKLNVMYIEFQNTGGPPVSPPSFDRSGGRLYYDGLSASDYLRVPIVAPPALSPSGAQYEGNQATFFAVTEGLAGVHSTPFNTTSVVYGAALVAAPDIGDQSRDVVFSRVYTEIGSIQKEVGHEIGVTWTIRFN